MDEERFDVIIVGGGLSGLACAYKLGISGKNVLLLERGKYIGAKNMWGGAYYGNLLPELLKDHWSTAPVERKIVRHAYSFMHKNQSFSFNYESYDKDNPHVQSFTMLRARFDRWFADKVEKTGVIVACGIEVTDLYRENGKVCGVISGDEIFKSNLVVLCEGVQARLTEKAGLGKRAQMEDIKQGVKEVISLPSEVIEQRLNLRETEGLAWQFVGDFSSKMPGGAFLYTNKDSLSIGAVIQLSAIEGNKITCNDVLENFKNREPIKSILKEGEMVEYSAHLIPVSGMNMMPSLAGDGVLVAGDAGAFVVGTGLVLDGANYAIASGLAAAEAFICCSKKNDYSVKSLKVYTELLKKSFVLKDLKTFRKAPRFLENEKIYSEYPELVCKLLGDILYGTGEHRNNLNRIIRDRIGKPANVISLVKDCVKMVMSL